MNSEASTKTSSPAIVLLAWIAVGVPLLFGVVQTIGKAAVLFK
jgi:hypothetical protein